MCGRRGERLSWLEGLVGFSRDCAPANDNGNAASLWADAAKPYPDEDERIPTMSDITFNCPRCGTRLAVDGSAAGMAVSCPNCSQTLLVPAIAGESPPERLVPLASPRQNCGSRQISAGSVALGAVCILIIGLCAGLLIARSTREGVKPRTKAEMGGTAALPIASSPETNSAIPWAQRREVERPAEPQVPIKPPEQETGTAPATATQTNPPSGLTARSLTNLFHTTFENGDLSDWRFTDARGQATSPPGWHAARQADGTWVLEGKGHNWANLAARHDWGDFVLRVRLRVLQGGLHLNYRINPRGRYFIGFNTNDIAVLKSYFTDLSVPESGRSLSQRCGRLALGPDRRARRLPFRDGGRRPKSPGERSETDPVWLDCI